MSKRYYLPAKNQWQGREYGTLLCSSSCHKDVRPAFNGNDDQTEENWITQLCYQKPNATEGGTGLSQPHSARLIHVKSICFYECVFLQTKKQEVGTYQALPAGLNSKKWRAVQTWNCRASTVCSILHHQWRHTDTITVAFTTKNSHCSLHSPLEHSEI